MIAAVRTAVDRLVRRVHQHEEIAARAHGLAITKVGRFNLSREYRDPRWDQLHESLGN